MPRESAVERLAGGAAGLRIAYSPTLGFATVDREVAALVADAVEVFTRLGATVERADPGFDDPIEPFSTLWYAAAAKSLEPLGRRGPLPDGPVARRDRRAGSATCPRSTTSARWPCATSWAR